MNRKNSVETLGKMAECDHLGTITATTSKRNHVSL